jgi:hypothetical protein
VSFGREPGFLVRQSEPGFVVWSGWHSSTRLPSCFTPNDIVGYGTTTEAAEAIVRLLESPSSCPGTDDEAKKKG